MSENYIQFYIKSNGNEHRATIMTWAELQMT